MLRNQRGFTMIELMLALSLTAIVLALAASYFHSSNRILAEGKARADVQHELRLATEQISFKIRNAKTLTLTTATPDTNSSWIYLSSGLLKARTGVAVTSLTHKPFIQSIDFTTTNDTPGRYMLHVVITSTDGYSLTTDILLNNMSSATPPSGSSGNALQYTLP